MNRRVVAVAVVAVSVAALAQLPALEPTASAATVATVSVDGSAPLGRLNNPAGYQNQSGPRSTLGPADLAQVQRLAPAVTRVWVSPADYYDEATGGYDFNYPVSSNGKRYHDYLDQVVEHSGRLLLNLGPCDAALLNPDRPDLCRDVLAAGIRHYRQRYPQVAFVEVLNEPDKTWQPEPGEAPALTAAEYYRWYRVAYEAVNRVNAELDPAPPIAVGGPVTYTFDGGYLREFLDLYRADPAADKRLDFVAYHEYKRRADPSDVRTAKSTIRGWLTNRGLNPDTPVFVTEYGVFPGMQSGTTFAEDVLTQSAAMATLGMYYIEGGTDMPMHWVFNHSSNDRKSMFVDGSDGLPYPYYNVVRMQRMLGPERIVATSSALSPAGIGVHALATRDSRSMAVLLTNYQWTTGADSYDVALGLANPPADLAGRPVRLNRYLVDATTSNAAHDPATAQLQLVESVRFETGIPTTVMFPLARNATTLVTVTPENP